MNHYLISHEEKKFLSCLLVVLLRPLRTCVEVFVEPETQQTRAVHRAGRAACVFCLLSASFGS